MTADHAPSTPDDREATPTKRIGLVDAFIGLGSNVEPMVHLPRALRSLEALGHVAAVSRFYRTPAIGRPHDPDFVNGVARLATRLSPYALRDALHSIEFAAGRRQWAGPDRYAPRKLDLDLLLYGALASNDPRLRLPHPDVTRPFVAACLAELEPDLRLPNGHPVSAPGERPWPAVELPRPADGASHNRMD